MRAHDNLPLTLVADCDGILWRWLSLRYHATATENGKLLISNASQTNVNVYSWVQWMARVSFVLETV